MNSLLALYRKIRKHHARYPIFLHENISLYLPILGVLELRMLIKLGELVAKTQNRNVESKTFIGWRDAIVEYYRPDLCEEAGIPEQHWEKVVTTLQELNLIRVEHACRDVDTYFILTPCTTIQKGNIKSTYFLQPAKLPNWLTKKRIIADFQEIWEKKRFPVNPEMQELKDKIDQLTEGK